MMHSFDVNIAAEYGIVEAILVEHLAYWIRKNKANDKNAMDGRYWTYNSMRAYAELFSYLSEKQIRRAIQHLIQDGIVMDGNFNKSPYDHTKWYAFTDKGMGLINEDFKADRISQMETFFFPVEETDLPKKENRNSSEGRPIPNSIPVKYTNKETGEITSSSNARETNRGRIVDESSDDEKPVDLFTLWDKNISPMTPLIAQDIQEMVKDFGEDAVRFGIETACRNGVRKSAYVQSCARNYLSGGPSKQQDKKGNPKNDVVSGVAGALRILEKGVF